MKAISGWLATLIMLAAVSGCSQQAYVLRQVTICLIDEKGLDNLSHIIDNLSIKYMMKLKDGGFIAERSARGSHDSEKSGPNNMARPVIEISAKRSDGSGLSLSNLGLARYQIIVGFFGSKNSKEVDAFIADVIARLKSKWNVVEIPLDKGAMPMSSCE